MVNSKKDQRATNEIKVWTRKHSRHFVNRKAPKLVPPKRMNFNWDAPRFEKIWLAARLMDISIEAFLRFAAYDRALRVLAEDTPEPIDHERANHRPRHRGKRKRKFIDNPTFDLLPFQWRWRPYALEKVKLAAALTQCDYRTFIDVAAYEKAVEIAGPEPV